MTPTPTCGVIAAQEIGLHVNEGKMKYMSYNVPQGDLQTLNGSALEEVDDFQYLEAWADETGKDIEVRIAKGWGVLNKMETVWKSKLSRNLKVRFFQATVESVIIVRCGKLTLTRTLEKRLDGAYTRMLRAALDISWTKHITNIELYGNLPKNN